MVADIDAPQRLAQLLEVESAPTPTELDAARAAWTRLLTRATQGPIAVADVRKSLCELDPVWAQPNAAMLTCLLDEASTRVKALATVDPAGSISRLDDATRAACDVQFRLAQFAAASRIPAAFA